MEARESERRAAFLQEYEAICRKYGAIVDSCGCCPPYVWWNPDSTAMDAYFAKRLES